MQGTPSFFPALFYPQYLSTIRDISFTRREIDVMACLLGARKTSKIAYLLSIDPRTVETYIRNITLKLECNTREGIIDFLELSDKVPYLRKHYSYLQIESSFEKSLKDLAKLIRNITPSSVILSGEKEDRPSSLTTLLKAHLQLAGITIAKEGSTKGEYLIYPLAPNLENVPLPLAQVINKYPKNKILFLLLHEQKKRELPKELQGYEAISIKKYQNYYSYVFGILKTLFPHLKLDHTFAVFQEKYEKIQNIMQSEYSLQTSSHPQKEQLLFFEQIKSIMFAKKWHVVVTLLIVSFVSMGFLNFYWKFQNKPLNHPPALSELAIPAKSVFLNRPELLSEIKKGFAGKEGIQTLAIVGIGGAGKTTLAREYARQQKGNVIWEINAETHTSLTESFENLAHALSKTEEDKKILRELLEIKDAAEKEKMVVGFVKERLRLYSNWLLIYDNVEDFSDLQSSFPVAASTWGNGRVILTTQNQNIQNNKQVDGIVLLDELNPAQKLSLYRQILNQGKNHALNVSQNKELIKFLKQLPPFPLDISIAAYYLKTTNVSYEQYLDRLAQQDKTFTIVQENLLKEAGEYTKTRYGIITLAVEQLIKSHKGFADLLLFMSLLDSQNIPKELLDLYKNPTVVDNFIYHLKKYSLILNSSSVPSVDSALSIHRSTQAITLDYLMQKLDLEKDSSSIELIGNTLKNYLRNIIDTADFSRMKSIINHSEVFLSHENLLPNVIYGTINGELGCFYHMLSFYNKSEEYLQKSLLILKGCKHENLLFRPLSYLGGLYWRKGQFEKSQEFFEESIENYKKFKVNDINGICDVLSCLGKLYTDQSRFEKAKNVLEQSLLIHQKSHSKNHSVLTLILVNLGGLYRKMGEYKKARFYVEKALSIDKKYYPNDSLAVGGSLANLGLLYSCIGYFEEAKNLYIKSLTISKQYFPETSLSFAWEQRNLGAAYNDLGDFKKAHNLLEQSFLIFKQTLGLSNIKTQWICFLLGEVYKNRGDLEKAKTLFEGCLSVYIKNYGKDSIDTADVLRELGEIYLLGKNIEKAEDFLTKALNINQMRKHPLRYKVLELYADLHIKKSLYAANKGDTQQALNFKMLAINDLKQALEIVTTHFPEDSPHRTRIEKKIEKLEQG